jgi:branched-chain amino acid transport system permease protein
MKRVSALGGPVAGPLAFVIAGIVLVPALLSDYYIFLATTAVIAAVALQSLGVVSGRAGMLSLCQMSFAAIGAYTVAWLNVHHAPGDLLLWILLGGLAAVPFGLAIGLPSLRLRGINLAVATLGFATCADVVLGSTSFPGQTDFIAVPRPSSFLTDTQYFKLCLVVFGIVAVVLALISRTRLGASWTSIAHSERATAAHGVSVPRSKLSAFALSSFIAGISGGLLAGQLGTLVADNFNVMQSLVLFALATMAGSQYAEGAVFGGVLSAFFPELLRRLHWAQDLGNIFFAVGATQALSAGTTQSEALRGLLRRHLPKRPAPEPPPPDALPPAPERARSDEPALAVRGLRVEYGSIRALDGVDLVVPQRSVAALVGPNGAGKSTFIDAVSGFLARYDGTVDLDGRPLEGLTASERARAGVRRTFQQTRIAPDLTVGQYLRLAVGRSLTTRELDALLAWLGCPPASARIAEVDVGSRRAVDVAAVVAARPRLVMLDEPAAGQAHDESVALAQRIADLPARFGTSVLLVEHDIDLVRVCSSSVTVLDFGVVIASGAPDETLAAPEVVKAYLGVPEDQEVTV